MTKGVNFSSDVVCYFGINQHPKLINSRIRWHNMPMNFQRLNATLLTRVLSYLSKNSFMCIINNWNFNILNILDLSRIGTEAIKYSKLIHLLAKFKHLIMFEEQFPDQNITIKTEIRNI